MAPINLKANDIVIAVMGVTGSGKSEFIQNFVDEQTGVGHSLVSQTTEVTLWAHRDNDRTNGPRIFFVDTPGFDDTTRSDGDILKEIAGWLTESYSNNIKLSGLIYLHRISDVRVGGAASKNLRMFKSLCGDNGLSSVVLATTHWQTITSDPEWEAPKDLKRQEELERDFWNYMISRGSKTFKHKDVRTATEIIDYLVKKRRQVTLKIQDDMVNKKMSLSETDAGKVVQDEIEKMRKVYEEKLQKLQQETDEALRRRDESHRNELRKTKQALEEKIAQGQRDLQGIRVSSEQLRNEIKSLEQKARESDSTSRLKDEAQRHELEIQKLRFEIERERVKSAEKRDLEEEKRSREEERRKLLEKIRQLEQAQEDKASCILM